MTILVGANGGHDGSLNDAGAGTDYTALGTTLTFTGGGATAQTVSVATIDDTVVEGSEDYTVTIASPTAGTVATSQANTVIADDGDSTLLSWTIAGDSSVEEGGTASYTVSYTGASLAPGQTMTILVGSNGGYDNSLNDAEAGTYYTALGTTLTITGGGATAQTVLVSTIDDTELEGIEDYTVTIASPTAGTVATSQANTVIADDGDSTLLSWTIAGDSSVTEGGTASYTVSYTGASLAPGQTMTILVGSNGGYDGSLNDAGAGTDYTALGTTLTFTGGGATAQTVLVSTIDDTELEGIEDYTVTIASRTAGTVATSQANTVIEDDSDATLPVWEIVGDTAVTEGNTAVYTVSYTGLTLGDGQTMTIQV